MKIIYMLCLLTTVLNLQAQKKVAIDSFSPKEIQKKIDNYALIDLTFDVNNLPRHEANILPELLIAAEIADSLFWRQTFAGSKFQFIQDLKNDTLAKYFEINYGPWERLNNNKPFIKGVGPKPKGANFYPADITKQEFEQWNDSTKNSPYTIILRDEKGKLKSVPYSEYYDYYLFGIEQHMELAATRVIKFDSAFGKYLYYRGVGLHNNQYDNSDILWLQSKNNILDIIIGPIETYEDQFNGVKAAYEAYIVAKDTAWSNRLHKYVALLPSLQQKLPVGKDYITPLPGLNSQIGAYDVIYYSGDCNSGSKTIAVNLPNDEGVQTQYGTRRLQFKNVMKAKFDSILIPVSNVLIDSAQRKYITFDAFFANTMFHEVAHGLGIKNTILKNESVSLQLGEYYSALEEGKADVLGLFMITELLNSGDITTGSIEEFYTTFVASIFRSIRFGASSAHGKANMVRLNFFMEKGALMRNANGTYTINYDKMKIAVYELSGIILKIQGDGDKLAAQNLLDSKGFISPVMKADLDNLITLSIPIDIIFNQGLKYINTSRQGGNSERPR